MKHVLVIGGAGYVGAKLVLKLINNGYKVSVIDWLIYGNYLPLDRNLSVYKLDIRESNTLNQSIRNIKPDTVIALASISNDPMGDLKPLLTKEVNIDATKILIDICVKANVGKFIFASSSSVYGENEDENIDEVTSLAPLTLYSQTKVIIEEYLKKFSSPHFTTVCVRPATVCGWSPRQRIDLIVNLLTYYGYYNKQIAIEGGERVRPHIHIDDMVNVYIELLNAPSDLINGKVYNAGAEYFSLNKLGELVQQHTGCDIRKTKGPDNRSHRLNSNLIKQDLGLKFEKTVEIAVLDMVYSFENHLVDTEDKRCFNMKWYQQMISENKIC